MPKLGRRSERTELDYQMANDIVRKDAPYGNDDTQFVTMKIVGGRQEYFMEQHPKYNPQGGGSRVQILRPIAEKPNHLDPRIHGDNPGGYYKDVQEYHPLDHEGFNYQKYFDELGDQPTAYNRRPDSKDVVRGQFKALPPIQQNRTRNDMSTVFEMEPWIKRDENPSLSRDTEYKQNFLTGQEDLAFDNYRHSDRGYNEPSSVSDYDRQQLLGLVPPNVLLPVDPIRLSREQETTLCKLICNDLRDFNPKELKDVYVECSHWDKNLEGYCTLEVLDQKLRNHRAHLSETIRPLAGQFVDPRRPGYVNYEKVLSFIGSAIKLNEKGQFGNQLSYRSDEKNGKYFKQNGEPHHTVSMYTERELAKTLRTVEQELTKNSYSFNSSQWEHAFQRMDREHRETLSAAQIKDISYDLKLPLSDSLVNKILQHCESGNRDGQYKWEKFLKFLERLRPTNTGLPIPKRGTSPRRDYQGSPRRGDNRPDDRGQSPAKQASPSNERNNNSNANGQDRKTYQFERRYRDDDRVSPRGYNDRSPEPYRDRRNNSPEPHNRFNSPTRDKNGYYDRQEKHHTYPINGYDDYDRYENRKQDNERGHYRWSRKDRYDPKDGRRHTDNDDRRRSFAEDPRSYIPSWQHEARYKSRSPPPPRRINERETFRDDRKTDSAYERHWRKWAYKSDRDRKATYRVPSNYCRPHSYIEPERTQSRQLLPDPSRRRPLSYRDDLRYDRGRDTYRRDRGDDRREDTYRDTYRKGGDDTYRKGGDRGDDTHRSREEQIDHLSHQIKDLETKHQLTKDGFKSNEKPWKDRFILMAQALYNSDISNKGSLPQKDVQAIVQQYNSAFNLDLNMDRVRMMYISPENLDKSNNIILRSFLVNLSSDKNTFK